MALNIIGGVIARPQKVVIYGSEGIGKTTLAKQMPNPLFIDVEDGSAHIDVRRIPRPNSWAQLLSIVDEVARTPSVCNTLIIDTADAAEAMCIKHICEKYGSTDKPIANIESFGYGKGYQILAEEYSKLLRFGDRILAAGMNMVFVAHAKMRKMELPDEQGSFDRWEMKLTRNVAPLLKEWTDALLFLNYKTFIVQASNEMDKAKARGGKRVIYTSHSPVWDAKNRHGLPDELPLSYESIAPIFNCAPKSSTRQKLKEMLDLAGYSDDDLKQLVLEKGYFPKEVEVKDYPEDFIVEWIFPNWEKITTAIEDQRLPF